LKSRSKRPIGAAGQLKTPNRRRGLQKAHGSVKIGAASRENLRFAES